MQKVISLSLIDILNIISVISILTISSYHYLLSQFNAKETKFRNKYFMLLGMCYAGFIVLCTELDKLFIPQNLEIYNIYLSFFFCLLGTGIMISTIKLYSYMYDIPDRTQKRFRIIYLSCLLSILLTSSVFFFDFRICMRYFFPVNMLIVFFNGIFIIIVFFIWIIKNKLYKKPNIWLLYVFNLLTGINILVAPFFILAWNITFFKNIQFLIIGFMVIFELNLFRKEFQSYQLLLFTNKNLAKQVNEKTKDLQKAKERIEKINEQKTRLFINLAHETKTPLTLISYYLDKYSKKVKASPELNVIKQNISKLKADMINYLDSEKLQRGEFLYNKGYIINITEITRQKTDLFKAYAASKQISIEAELEAGIFAKIDDSALDRILNNLLDNAIKYTPRQGKIKVSLSGQINMFYLSVEDNGPGLSKEQQKKIFEPYFKVSHTKHGASGSGMGLYIIKQIIQQFKGQIDVKNREQGGACFTVTLPACSSGIDAVLHETDQSETPSSSGFVLSFPEDRFTKGRKNILVVEDNIDFLNSLDEIFSDFNVFFAVNGREALEKIKTIPKPNVIVSDIMMDGMDGYEFYMELNRIPLFHDVPFIFLTVMTGQKEHIKALSMGAIDFINKPVTPAILKAKVASIIRNREMAKENNIIEMERKLALLFRTPMEENNTTAGFLSLCDKYEITKREKEIIAQLLEGTTNREIGEKLHISIETVKSHIQNIYGKCQVKNRFEVITLFSKERQSIGYN